MKIYQPLGRFPAILMLSGLALLGIYVLWRFGLLPISNAVRTAWEEHQQEEARQKEEDAKKDVIQHWWGTEIVSHPCTRLGIGERLPVHMKSGERRDFCEADYHRQIAWTLPSGCVNGRVEDYAGHTEFQDGVCNGKTTPEFDLHNYRVTFWALEDVTFQVCDKSCAKH